MDANKVIQTFMELVRIDSETRFEAEIGEDLTKRLQHFGFDVVCDQIGEQIGHQAGNLFATLAATKGFEDKPSLLFTCHMDTVAPGKNIQPQLDADGYIRSDGTTILGSDDKAGIAAFLEAIASIRNRGQAHGKIIFVVTVGEESGLRGSSVLTPASVQANYGFALDSNGHVGEIVVAAPTNAKLYVDIHGRKAHAGVNPEDGISAIEVASKAIARMKLGRISAQTTANIGSINGGQETNIVCDHVYIKAEARSLVDEEMHNQVNHMKVAFETAASELGATVEIKIDVMYPAYRLAPSDPVVQLAARAVEQIGRVPKVVESGGGSDANHFNRIGIPTVNLAIGYEHIHTTKEQIPVTELVKTTELIQAIILENNKFEG
ncbi:MAG: hypothetical protein RLZZ267_706 [Bacillota bacterium]|jgi:tripeptide aminopeptidase